MTTTLLVRSAALGAAAGARASLGVLAPALTGGGTTGTRVAVVLAATELVADKLPMAPSRLQPQSLAGRVASGAVGAGVLARRDGSRAWWPAVAGAVGAVAGSYGGAAWREVAAARGWTWQAAVAEDAVALGLVRLAVRRR